MLAHSPRALLLHNIVLGPACVPYAPSFHYCLNFLQQEAALLKIMTNTKSSAATKYPSVAELCHAPANTYLRTTTYTRYRTLLKPAVLLLGVNHHMACR